jgi:hypothetical protein
MSVASFGWAVLVSTGSLVGTGAVALVIGEFVRSAFGI